MYVEFLTYYKANYKTFEQLFFDKGDCIKLDDEQEAETLLRQGVVKPIFDDEIASATAA